MNNISKYIKKIEDYFNECYHIEILNIKIEGNEIIVNINDYKPSGYYCNSDAEFYIKDGKVYNVLDEEL